MNSKRKAEIQRRLTLSAVPKPPEGLADRIKSDIPKYLQASEAERERFTRSIAFNMRVAASIILLVTSVVVTMRVLSPADQPVAQSPAAVAAAPPQKTELRDVATVSTAAAADELRVEISEEPRPEVHMAETTSVAPPLALARRDRAGEREERDAEARMAVGGVVGGLAEGVEDGRVTQLVDAAPPPGEFAPVPAPEVMSNVTHPSAPVAQGAPQPAEAKLTARAAAPSIVREAVAADLLLAPKATVFGISVDPNAFDRVKTTIERGARPPASTINVEALVNYFAGAPKRVRREVQLEAEGSPAPIEGAGRRGIVRFTIDTQTRDLNENATVPPVATNARVTVEFNRRAVSEFRRIGVDDSIAAEATLLGNTSVTGLYEVELKPNIGRNTTIATITLRYTSIDGGGEKTRFVVVRGSDFARKWTLASRRHRLASLGAVWGESLKGSGDGSDLAMKAEELATQSPNDARAKELAAVTKVNSVQ